MNDLAVQSLEFVSRELATTMDSARRELESFVDGQADRAALARAADLLHLASGALKIVDVQGAALLAEEMEHSCRILVSQQDQGSLDRGLEALTRAMVQLPAYVERLMSGGRDVALVLLPLLNDLRRVQGKPLLTEGTLMLLGNAGQLVDRTDLHAIPGRGEPQAGKNGFHRAALRLRPAFQAALLGWIRDDRPAQNLRELLRVTNALEAAASVESVKQLWQVLGGLLVALEQDALEATVPLKRLVGQADRQLKRLIDAGETVFASAPPVDLVNNLLFYIARADSRDPRIESIRAAYGLESLATAQSHIEETRDILTGPSIKLMRTVAQAITEDLSSVKDALDIFVRTGMTDAEKLGPQVDMLKKIGDTLGVLGLEKPRERIQREAAMLGGIVARQVGADEAGLERIAATLLEVEDELDRELVRAVVPASSETESSEGEATQYRHVMQAVMGECIVNLAKIKEAVTQLVAEPGNVRALDQVAPQLRGITAGLLMLNRAKAVRVIERIGSAIASRLGPGQPALKPDLLERLADAIVSVEYYMETLSAGRSDPAYMLENAGRCLDAIERMPAVVRPAPPAEVPQIPVPPPSPPAAVMQAQDDRSDPELLETFIEEAKEEIANVHRQLAIWRENPDATEALIAVRRSFHTLKGSGRMVGAQLIGEYAWSIENLLNRLINQTLRLSPAMLDFIETAAAALPQLIEQLEIGTAPMVDVPALMKQAEAYAGGEAEVVPGESTALVRVQADTGAQPSPAGAKMDPVLAEIFVKEMRGHLATIRTYLDEARAFPAPHAVAESLYRAFHTLCGSANMAAFEPAIRIAEPLADYLGAHFSAGSGLSDEGLRVLATAAEEVGRMADALATGREYDGDVAGVVAASASLAPQTVVEEAAPPAEAAQPAISTEYDPEIAAIFAEEAAELLERAESALQGFREHAADAEPLVELQRLLHTLKGGARMAGVTGMADVSHALEDMLAALADGRLQPTAQVVELLQGSVDTLHQMRDAVGSGQRLEEAADLLARIEAVARPETGAPSRAIPEVPSAQRAVAEAAPASAELAASATPAPAWQALIPVEPTGGDADWSGADIAGGTGIFEPSVDDVAALLADEVGPEPAWQAVSAEPGTAPPQGLAERSEAAESQGPRMIESMPDDRASPLAQGPAMPRPLGERSETARVDAGLLDTLLNGAGEISIFQSRLNQQVHSIEFHLGELGQTVTRLREQLRHLEAETEAQILHRHQDEPDSAEHFDPLELDRYSTIQQLSRALAETANDVASINDLLRGLTSEAESLLTQQARVTGELQDGLMQTRMVPFQRHASRLARIVRQAATDTGKPCQLVVDGAASELDRQVLDSMLPAFEHLLRNAVVHGIERPADRQRSGKAEIGTVTLKLRREGSEVLIEVGDDGAGLDLAAIRSKAREQGLVRSEETISDQQAAELILRPGFSTAEALTQSAGRGVGLDVVDNEIKKLGGSLRIETTVGAGTRFFIRLPYTLAITQALIVNVGDETFALPLPTIEGIVRLPREDLLNRLTQDDPQIEYAGISYRIQHLGGFVGAAPSALPEEESAVALVLVRAGDSSTALLTDSLEGNREIVVKTLGSHLTSIRGVSGATILGDGRIIVILDAPTLVRSQAASREPIAQVARPQAQVTALVVDDSITMRRVTQRLLERRGVRVLTARDGLDALGVLQEHMPDILLLDIEMPRMDGYQLAKHVRNDPRTRNIPIIMITSRSGEKHRARAIEIGVNDYLNKPYQEGQLVAAMEALVGRAL